MEEKKKKQFIDQSRLARLGDADKCLFYCEQDRPYVTIMRPTTAKELLEGQPIGIIKERFVRSQIRGKKTPARIGIGKRGVCWIYEYTRIQSWDSKSRSA